MVLSHCGPERRTRSERGMTLVELLIAMAIGAILTTLVFQFFNTQSVNFAQGRDNSEMQQELRWAMQFISEHVRLAGNTVPQVLLDETGYQVIENYDGAGDDPDSLSIVGSFKSVVITLDQTMGNEGSQVKCSDKANDPAVPLTDIFTPGDIVFISDGTFSEIFQITSIQGDHLFHETSLPWNDDKKLDHRYVEGSTLTSVTNYSFFVAPDEEGRPNLMVRTLVYPPQVLAGDVEQFQVRFRMRNGQWQNTVDADEINRNEVSQVEIYLRTRSREPIRGYEDPEYGDAYKRMELKTIVIPKNIAVL
ncbi:MAG: prepilin-type N-terminal cleavage/methylation domain-containing protein [Candidatus Latescibacterota bacterium]